ncbi:MAG: alpha/beta hydrolase fold domain-containing protein [Chloroflexota bacterium]
MTFCLAVLLSGCGAGPAAPTPAPTPVVLADTFFTGQALLDANGNRQVDESDLPLEGALFEVMGFQTLTDGRGYAMVIIPGGWDRPAAARMSAPRGSGATPISPNPVLLQSSGPLQAVYLFQPGAATAAAATAAGMPAGTPAPPPTLTPFASYTPVPTLTPQGQLGPDETLQATAPGGAPAAPLPTQPPPPPRAGAVLRDQPYCKAGAVVLKMDVYYPHRLKPAAPLVIYIHGGGWTSGDKGDLISREFFPALQQAGYTVAAINYRPAPRFKFPAMIEDVKCAVRSLRANAAAYQVDPQRIALLGASAGGHLAALAGLAGEPAGWDVGQYLDQSSEVQAVVDLFGPADLRRMALGGDRRLGEQVFGLLYTDDDLLSSYSPLTYVHADAPPFLLLHGDQDRTVPLQQSQLLYDALRAAGAPVELVVVQNAGHSFRQAGEAPIDPSLEQIVARVLDFLRENLAAQ